MEPYNYRAEKESKNTLFLSNGEISILLKYQTQNRQGFPSAFSGPVKSRLYK